MRFFAGEILEDTVKAVSVGPQQKLVDMPAPPEGEHEVNLSQQLPHNCYMATLLESVLPPALGLRLASLVYQHSCLLKLCAATCLEEHVSQQCLAEGSNCNCSCSCICTCRRIRFPHTGGLHVHPLGHTASITA